MQPRTRRQKDVLDYITRYISSHGHEPSYQQIARQLGVSSKAGIARHIQSLENQGLISRKRVNGSFSLELLSQRSISENAAGVEWLRASTDPEAEQWQLSAVPLPKFLIGERESHEICLHRIDDDSMIGKEYYAGDILIIERRSFAREGDIVAAETNKGEIIVHQYFRSGPNTELRPANDDHISKTFPADKVQIRGVVRGVIRSSMIH